MPEVHKLTAARRTSTANKSRQLGNIPGVLYGHNVPNKNVAVESRAFERVFKHAGSTTLVNLDIDGQAHNVLIREVQFHPVRDHVMHIDFYQVRMDEALHADVPLKFVGESSAVKDQGGIFVRNIDTIAVKALPKDLPGHIEVDISPLTSFTAVIHIADLTLPKGVEVQSPATDVIALVQPPRSDEELKSLEEEVKEDVSTIEATAEKKEEEPAEGEAAPTDGATPAAPVPEK